MHEMAKEKNNGKQWFRHNHTIGIVLINFRSGIADLRI